MKGLDTGRQREETVFDLFPASELYYTEESEDHRPDKQDDGDECEVSLRDPSPLWNPSPLRN